jgi:hypothetical protein
MACHWSMLLSLSRKYVVGACSIMACLWSINTIPKLQVCKYDRYTSTKDILVDIHIKKCILDMTLISLCTQQQ